MARSVQASLADVRRVPYWLDREPGFTAWPVPAARDEADLLVVGGGLTGLWTALQAVEREPGRNVVLLEGNSLGWAASGRNGGFCVASITHGLGNGMSRWPNEMPTLVRLGLENLDAIEAAIARYGIDCDFERTGELTVATAPWQVADLKEMAETAAQVGSDEVFLGQDEARLKLNSPQVLAATRSADGCAMLDPAKLVWGLAEAASRAGVRLYDKTRVTDLSLNGAGVLAKTSRGQIRARQVVLATSAFSSPLKRVRPFIVPVWDHVLVTEPLSPEQVSSIGWNGREGIGDAGNQFHYFRLTADHRILWGGYDALYYFGSDLSARRAANERTETVLAQHFFEMFPQLNGLRFTHAWGGAIDTCSRFSAFWMPALRGRVIGIQGFTGLGVGASRFAAGVGLDLLDGKATTASSLSMVTSKPVPFPPEPLRWLGIQATRRAIASADANEGRRGPWLRTLDALGLGFDS